MSSADPRTTALNLDLLESNPTPIFVTKVGARAINFEIFFCNEACRRTRLRDLVIAQDRATLLFRSWVQALGSFSTSYRFGDWIWSAEIAGIGSDWKIVKATDFGVEGEGLRLHKGLHDSARDEEMRIGTRGYSHVYKHSRDDVLKETSRSGTLLRTIPRTNLTASWESLLTMMEMSDVGVFEYDPTGKLIHANDAWYRLSSHPKDPPAHIDFSFMDLVYPDDAALVMSMWNALVQGNPVTFEMRWKAQSTTEFAAQWVLSACVPVFDDYGKLVSIAGNTIDISAQKKSQEVAQARVEALEQARASERKFSRFAELAPIAIYIFMPGNGMRFVNDQFFELTGQSHIPFDQIEWTQLILEDDLHIMEADWAVMMQGNKSEDIQFRLKKTWVNQDGVRSNIWVQGSSYPELDESGNVISIMGTLFDISQFKWAESVQRRRIEEALEAKRQQENFIDMTSHELRNPLSAIVQCADSVISTLHQLASRQLAPSSPLSLLSDIQEDIDTSIDSLHTIVSCSLHQKRVIDDVLTLSKLDSNLILITPIRVRPATVVSEAMKMFDVECSQMQIKLSFQEDASLLGLEWVMLDPSRLLQVLINLLTNAIKFTKDRPTRRITVTLGGAWTRPPRMWQSITFTDGNGPENDILGISDWGNGQKAYIWLKVEDTGCGMTIEEQKKLFSRFSQATPRTHVKYGGSGLGLFISKSLTTLQGGSIGVSSESNVGSTFAFYVSTRVAQHPTGSIANQATSTRPVPQRSVSCEEGMKAARLNILIVEDNLVNQRVLSKQLQKVGCNVSVAGNGQEALEWLQGSVYWRGEYHKEAMINDVSDYEIHLTPYGSRLGAGRPQKKKQQCELDIILMDIEMPVMDGLTCARLIRDYEQQGLLAAPQAPSSHSISPSQLCPRQLSSDTLPPSASFQEPSLSPSQRPRTQGVIKSWRLPILAVSANARSEQVEQALSAGMDDAISKPFRIPELWPKIESLVPRCSGMKK